MTVAAWPTGVPDTFESSGFAYDADSGVVRSDMDSGPPKVRRRFSSVSKNMKGTIIMTKAQFLLWETWFEDVVYHGSLSFTMTDPINGGSMTVRIVTGGNTKPYSWSINGLFVSLTFAVEKLP